MNHDVFISYSSRNKSTALALCHVLEEHRIRCWMAPRDIPIGADYGDVIDEAIVACRLFVLVFSEPASISQWVKGELNLAFSEKKIIIPYRIDETPLKGAMRLILNQTHWVEAYPDAESKFCELVSAAERFLGRQDELAVRTEKPDPVVSDAPMSNLETVRAASSEGSSVLSEASASDDNAAVRRYNVGDYYDVDGKRGIVFEVDETGQKGKIISLNETKLPVCLNRTVINETPCDKITKSDGAANLEVIVRQPDWKKRYPAFAWCVAQGEGWYLPAYCELDVVLSDLEVNEKVNAALRRLNAEILPDNGGAIAWIYYHHSSIDKQSVNLFEDCNCYVRAIAKF